MSDPYVGEIRAFGFNFAPRDWAQCNGQLLQIRQNTALFSILGTNYGGDGKNTFGLPDLRGRAPLNAGEGPGLTWRELGELSGQSSVGLIPSKMPPHTHAAAASSTTADKSDPTDNVWAAGGGQKLYATAADVPMSDQALESAGAGQSHNNMPPHLAVNFCICLQGVFPPRG